MAKYHESQIGKTQRIVGYVLSILFSIQILMAGVLKLIQMPDMVENMQKITNWGDKIVFIGVLELIILVLYWIPKTMKLGFLLMCSFVGGIIVAEVVSGQPPIAGIITAVLLYVGTALRLPSLLTHRA